MLVKRVGGGPKLTPESPSTTSPHPSLSATVCEESVADATRMTGGEGKLQHGKKSKGSRGDTQRPQKLRAQRALSPPPPDPPLRRKRPPPQTAQSLFPPDSALSPGPLERKGDTRPPPWRQCPPPIPGGGCFSETLPDSPCPGRRPPRSSPEGFPGMPLPGSPRGRSPGGRPRARQVPQQGQAPKAASPAPLGGRQQPRSAAGRLAAQAVEPAGSAGAERACRELPPPPPLVRPEGARSARRPGEAFSERAKLTRRPQRSSSKPAAHFPALQAKRAAQRRRRQRRGRRRSPGPPGAAWRDLLWSIPPARL